MNAVQSIWPPADHRLSSRETVQAENLERNYRNYRGARKIIAEKQCGMGRITIERHDRDTGTIAYYAVANVNGQETPLMYCVGHPDARPNRYEISNPLIRNYFTIASTFVHPRYQRQGVALALYTAIIETGISVKSDWDLNEGSTRLWEKLMDTLPRRTVIKIGDRYLAKSRPTL